MALLDKISLPILIISFSIGIFYIYITGNDLKSVYVYPTPENYEKIIYKDYAGNCHKYIPEVVNCAEHKSIIDYIPIQSNNE
jgi:hypothetical protein